MTPVVDRAARWWVGVALSLVLIAAGVLAASPLVAIVGPLLVIAGVAELTRRRERRADLDRVETLPVLVDRLVQELRSGASLGQACRQLGSSPGALAVDPSALRLLVVELDRGSGLPDASRALATQAGDPAVRLIAVTLDVLASNGGPAVPALRRLRHTLIGRVHRRHRSEAQAASVLASAALLVVAPVLFAVLLAGAEPDLARFYGRELLGAACVAASVVLSALGWWWIQWLMAGAGRADG